MTRRLLAFAIALALAGCGRTGLEVYAALEETFDAGVPAITPTDAGHDATMLLPDAAHADAARHDSGKPFDAGLFDPCPSLVLPGAPLPMYMNCSTRDGRSRAAGPVVPHVIWESTLGGSGTGPANPGVGIAADTSGNVYVTTGARSEFAPTIPTVLMQLSAATGAVGWMATLNQPTGSEFAPLLLPDGTVEALGNIPAGLVVDTYAPVTGAASQALLGATFNEPGIPAIGADGSQYVIYLLANVPPQPGNYVALRVLPDNTIGWMSSFLDDSAVFPIAIGVHGEILVSNGIPSTLLALDPKTGDTLWSTSFPGAVSSAPSVAPDGTIALTVTMFPDAGNFSDAGSRTALYLLSANGEVQVSVPVRGGGIAAISLEGAILTSGGDVFSNKGQLLWTVPGGTRWVPGTVLDARGTAYVYSADSDILTGLDVTTGARRWVLGVPPELRMSDAGAPWSASLELTVTSTGGFVVATNLGAFGAGD